MIRLKMQTLTYVNTIVYYIILNIMYIHIKINVFWFVCLSSID